MVLSFTKMGRTVDRVLSRAMVPFTPKMSPERFLGFARGALGNLAKECNRMTSDAEPREQFRKMFHFDCGVGELEGSFRCCIDRYDLRSPAYDSAQIDVGVGTRFAMEQRPFYSTAKDKLRLAHNYYPETNYIIHAVVIGKQGVFDRSWEYELHSRDQRTIYITKVNPPTYGNLHKYLGV
jgi:hypothetical protein